MPLADIRAMTAIEYRKGDATKPVADGHKIIAHICNDVGGWGKGFVVAVSRLSRAPEREYRAWHRDRANNDFDLGAVQLVAVSDGLSVANMVAQRGIRPEAGVPPIRYDALNTCLSTLAAMAQQRGASVHMPRIGCGLAGGTWPEVEARIAATLLQADVPVFVYDFE